MQWKISIKQRNPLDFIPRMLENTSFICSAIQSDALSTNINLLLIKNCAAVWLLLSLSQTKK